MIPTRQDWLRLVSQDPGWETDSIFQVEIRTGVAVEGCIKGIDGITATLFFVMSLAMILIQEHERTSVSPLSVIYHLIISISSHHL